MGAHRAQGRAGTPTGRTPTGQTTARVLVGRGHWIPFSASDLALVTEQAKRELASASVQLKTAENSLVTSLCLLRAAEATDPHRWGSVTVSEPARISAEGGELADTGWTVVAAEAAHLAQYLPRTGARPDIHDLALAAILLPSSMAAQAVPQGRESFGAIFESAGLSVPGLLKALTQAAKAPAGALIMARQKFFDDRRALAELPVGDWREWPNPAYREARPSRVTVRDITMTRAETMPRETLKGVRHRSLLQENPVPELKQPASVTPGAGERQRSVDGAAGRSLLTAWSPSTRVLWWLLRPLLTVTAAAACLLACRTGAGPILAVGSALLVIVIRPIRRWWAGLALALGCLFVSPVAAGAVAARTLVTLAALLINGRGWDSGLARLVESRQRALGGSDLADAWAAVEKQLTGPREIGFDFPLRELLEVLGAAWCEADILIFATTVVQVLRGLLFRAWPFGRIPSVELTLLYMLVVESATSLFFRTVAMLSGGVAGFVLSRGATRWLMVIIGTVVAWIWAKAQPRTLPQTLARGLPVTAVLSVVMYFVLQSPGLWTVLASTVMGMTIGFLNTRALRLRTRRTAVSPLPARLRYRRGHRLWHAARAAMNRGQPEAADRRWRQLATGSMPAHPEIRVLSCAMLADLALDRAQWQEALDWSDQAVAETPVRSPAGYLTRVVRARVMLAAGNPGQAVALLHEIQDAGFAPRLYRDRIARLVLARALAMTGDVKEARAVLSRIGVGMPGAGLGPMIESEAVVATMAGEHDRQAAAEQLKSALEWTSELQTPDTAASSGDNERLDRAAARAWLALGNLQLRLGESDEAESSLRRAITTLPIPAELANQATARVLLGCALAERRATSESLAQISRGLTELESTRGQLRNSFLRSQLVIQLDNIYGRALDALQAQQATAMGAGQIAAVLLESLRRDALAALLRQDRTLELQPQAQVIQDRINALESRASLTAEEKGRLAALREGLGREISTSYAKAYSPDPVVLADIRRRAAHSHVLTFKIAQANQECLRGHTVWLPPEGEPHIAAVMLTSPDLLAAVGLLGQQNQAELMRKAQYPGDQEFQRWLDLGENLLPAPLRARLRDATRAEPIRLMIVPDGPLAAFPWAALRIADGRHLVEVASIHVIPAMSLMEIVPPLQPGPVRSASSAGGRPILLHRDADARDDMLALLSTAGKVLEARSRPEIESLLASGILSGAYFSVHGNGAGLDQNLQLYGGAQISAASALALRWPQWLIFASCIVGSLQMSAGAEPTGLVTSCLLGGASSVVAGVVEVHAGVADRICVALAARLIHGWHPADALRQAQLSFIESRDTASVHRWGGYICVSRLAPPGHRNRRREGGSWEEGSWIEEPSVWPSR